ncbi:E3 ubiquitin-protein ligase RNF212B [Melopsittacus undulatus]|uniref:E3 ubiquitin-protein ligase RNF212B n=1 Tax=Melopsittacus undulatus TaxID=13146 RepID=UPI00146CF69F|nr:RING finger protein 212B [Melopsittacus undulatus]
MDWFHCNKCFRQEGARFTVTSCGHVLCAACGAAGPCPLCSAACSHLPISSQMRPQEKLFFESPAAIALKHLASIAQVWRFERTQAELLLSFHRQTARRHRAAMEEAKRELGVKERELESLRRENTELRRAQLSPAWRGGSRSSTPRPIGVTSPAHTVTPQPRRQLSSQVVSRSAPQEPPPLRNTPLWHLGSTYRVGSTPSGSSVGERTPNLLDFYPSLHGSHSPWP